ncbi:hypothetical protein CDIK_1892 [Cucumispora dikerogammari]|nr:hypothetical protein CDIK_1892 [Cucumispora dikerogammari]
MSDRDLGLILAISEILPLPVKLNCVRHIAKNLKLLRWSRQLIETFWSLVYIKNPSKFDLNFEQLRLLNPQFYEELNNIELSSWAASECLINNYAFNTSNSAESMNSALAKFISMNITNLIIEINNYNMKMFNERRSSQFNFVIIEKQLNITSSNVTAVRFLSVSQSYENVYLVDNHFIVDLVQKKCSCYRSFADGCFCIHICAALQSKKADPNTFIENYFKSSNYYNSYSGVFFPLSNSELTSDEILSPQSRRARGRPRIVRIIPISGH